MRYLLVLALLCLSAPALASPVEVNYTVEGHAGDWTLDFSLRNNLTPSGNAPVDFVLYQFGVSLPESSIVGQPSLAWTASAPIAAGYNDSWTFDTIAWYGPNPPNHGAGVTILFPQTTVDGFLIHSSATEAPTSASWMSVGSAMWGNGVYGAHSMGMYSGSPTRIATFLGSSTGTVIEAPQSPPPPQGAAVPEPSSLLFGLIAFAVGGLIAGRGMIR